MTKKPSIFSDASLEKFVSDLKMSLEDKQFLLEKIPQLDLDQRKSLFKLLFDIYLLNLEEGQVLKRFEEIKKEK